MKSWHDKYDKIIQSWYLMEENFTIDEILSAVDEIQKKKKKKDIETGKKRPDQEDFSAVPKNTLKLIEEAENN